MERDDLWAIPTAEVPLTSLHRDEVLAEADLPLRYTAHTSCFRREAGAAGRDTRGLLRVHEFDKVELLAVAKDAEQAIACQEDILARSEALLAELGLPYRVLDLCTGDVGASAARTWDLEAYAPGCDMWLEVSSVSWFSDYQARRANIRYRPGGAKGTEVCHTVNGSAMGWSRTVAAYLETHRQTRRLDRDRQAAPGLPRHRDHPRGSLTLPWVTCLPHAAASALGGTRMQKFWAWLGLNLGKRAGVVSIIGLVITVVLGAGITRLEFATGQDSYLNKGEDIYKDSVAYQDLFGGQAMVTLVTLADGQDLTDLFTPEAVEAWRAGRGRDQGAGRGPDLRRRHPARRPRVHRRRWCCRSRATSSMAWPPRSCSRPPSAIPTEEGKAARTASSLRTLERVNAIPPDEREIGNAAWNDFLLHDNEGEIRKSLRPFFPNETQRADGRPPPREPRHRDRRRGRPARGGRHRRSRVR